MIRRARLDLRSLRAQGDDAEDLVGGDDDLARLSRRVSANSLSIHDVAEVCGAIVKRQRKEILEHVQRLFRLAEIKAHKSVGDETLAETRYRNMHRRLCMLESELRQLNKKLGRP